MREITYRKIKSIDLDRFREDLRSSELCNKIYPSLDDMVSGYDSSLSSILNKHAPLKTKTLVCRRRVPWFNSDIKSSILVLVLLVLLDLSSVFDTVNHQVLLERLRSRFGVTGNALKWFTSYLSGRVQLISVNGGTSDAFHLNQGVPQGSCLGPLLFTVYTSELFDIIEKHIPSVHCYADDTQLYLAFSPNKEGDDAIAIEAMRNCIKELRVWMTRNRLMLNDDKTDFLLMGTRQQLLKVNFTRITVSSEVIECK